MRAAIVHFTGKVSIASIVICLCANLTSFAQAPAWPPPGWTDSVHCERHHSGYVCAPSCTGIFLMHNGDTLRNAYIRIWARNSDLLRYRESMPTKVLNRDVDAIYVYKDVLNKNKVELKHLPGADKDIFWRLIVSKGNNSIYDACDERSFTNEFSYSIKLFRKTGDPLKIYGMPFFSDKKNRKKRRILKFINHRYKEHFNAADFPTTLDMLKYIVDAEDKNVKT